MAVSSAVAAGALGAFAARALALGGIALGARAGGARRLGRPLPAAAARGSFAGRSVRGRRPAGDTSLATPPATAAISAITIQSSHGT